VTPEPTTVVGAAILDKAGRVLAAQRAAPVELRGLWEFPGGKVEPGECPEAALIRECREELGVTIRLVARLGEDLVLQNGRAVLRVWTAIVADGGEPRALEHLALRWLGVHDLDQVSWLPADAPLVDALRSALPR
jgi:8-oxo-dGTP diphosphatase